MLKTIQYAITFSNGKKLARELAFEPQGTTLITGRNEAGKSMNLEMAAYALFGNVALRGQTSDYSRLKCVAEFEVKGIEIHIDRTKTNATLTIDGKQVATGTKPVNEAVIAQLGYDYAVFRVAHLAAQGDLQALSTMKPTERKAMVDTVSGLNQLDDVAKDLDAERKELRGTIAGAEQFLREPVKPEAPTTDRGALKLAKKALDVKMSALQECQLAKAPTHPTLYVAKTLLAEPTMPEQLGVSAEPTSPVRPESWTPEAHDKLMAFEQQVLAAQKVQEPAVPALTTEEIEEHREILRTVKRVAELKALLAQGVVTCEKCGHETPLAANLIEEKYSDVDPNYSKTTPYTETDLTRISLGWESYETSHKAFIEAQTLVEGSAPLQPLFPVWSQYAADLSRFQQAHKAWGSEVATAEHYNKQQQAQYKKHLQEVKTANDGIETWNSQVEEMNTKLTTDYEADLAKWDEVQAKLEELKDVPENLDGIKRCLEAWTLYDQSLARYNESFAQYAADKARIEEMKDELLDLDRAKKALQETKTNVKSYLTPALSRVASQLLNEMTGGERNTVVIDEDFDVMVDGQPLRTLSGSGKDIVNLAIRIALGQVLTHSVMPMMLLDEIDQGMDADRARYTQECLQRITPSIGQVLIVSHRPTTSDYVVEL